MRIARHLASCYSVSTDKSQFTLGTASFYPLTRLNCCCCIRLHYSLSTLLPEISIMSASDLPTELVFHIIKFVQYRPDLYSCSLVCRQWRHPAQRRLFSSFVFRSSKKKIDQYRKIVRSGFFEFVKFISNSVKTVYYHATADEPWPWAFDFLLYFGTMEELVIGVDVCRWDKVSFREEEEIPMAFNNLTRLSLLGHRYSVRHHAQIDLLSLSDLVCNLPRLSFLELRRVSLDVVTTKCVNGWTTALPPTYDLKEVVFDGVDVILDGNDKVVRRFSTAQFEWILGVCDDKESTIKTLTIDNSTGIGKLPPRVLASVQMLSLLGTVRHRLPYAPPINIFSRMSDLSTLVFHLPSVHRYLPILEHTTLKRPLHMEFYGCLIYKEEVLWYKAQKRLHKLVTSGRLKLASFTLRWSGYEEREILPVTFRALFSGEEAFELRHMWPRWFRQMVSWLKELGILTYQWTEDVTRSAEYRATYHRCMAKTDETAAALFRLAQG
ncbi:hypothetical protein BT69DRAFT_1347427 [Atractiella rhizophila]|nr:hypothetical protein BT69DRAFT_1347427 [Atractiella rhizophila]